MGWIAWIIVGLVAGFLAKLVMPGRDPGGFIVTMIIGIVGGVIGGFIGMELGFGDVTGINFKSILLATGGAVILLAVYRGVQRNR